MTRKAAKRASVPRISNRDRIRWQRGIIERLRGRYGWGAPQGAWAHMSAEQRSDAVLAEAAILVCQQDEETAARWPFARAVAMIETLVADFAEHIEK